MEEDDFLQSLEQFRAQWAEEHKVTGTALLSLTELCETDPFFRVSQRTSSKDRRLAEPTLRSLPVPFRIASGYSEEKCSMVRKSRFTQMYVFCCPFSQRARIDVGAMQLYRYDPTKNEWRRFTSPTQPGPRSAHQVVGTVAGGGKYVLRPFSSSRVLTTDRAFPTDSGSTAVNTPLRTNPPSTTTAIFGLSTFRRTAGSDGTRRSGPRHGRDIGW
jgi:hypothetical protein